ncbi:MAG: ArsR family transcriptional regulator [Methanobrevibacter sp.]|jgi:predicted transcriptional regulator|nr:ArsR family transcriptional regulator [Candidatus Methanoflexus mossambicus]
MTNEIIELLSFVEISQNRSKILKSLNDGALFPSKIAKNTDIRINQVSTTLKELKEKELVVLLNPDAKIGRYYELTDKGKEIAKRL